MTAVRSPAARKVLSDRIVVEITQKPGESFIDRMIALVEGASRQKTPNEIALNILLASLTIIFLLATVTLQPLAIFAKANPTGHSEYRGAGRERHHRHRARLVAGVPYPDDDRRVAVGDRHRRHGPTRAAQRARHERPRGRGGRRRQHAVARQDRHDHPRQPAGDRVPAVGEHPMDRARRCGATVFTGRRDAGGTLGRRAGQDCVRAAGTRRRRTDPRDLRRRSPRRPG